LQVIVSLATGTLLAQSWRQACEDVVPEVVMHNLGQQSQDIHSAIASLAHMGLITSPDLHMQFNIPPQRAYDSVIN
jgi:hypothetical protein